MINDKGFVDAYAAIYEKKEEKRWQDDDGDGKWYEKSDVDGKTSKREKDEKKTKKEDYETKKKGEVLGAMKKQGRKLSDKEKNKIADKVVKDKGDTSKSDDRYAYESVTPEVEKVDEVWGAIAKTAATQGAKFVAKRGGKAAVKKAAISGGKTAAKWAAVDAVASKAMGGDQQDESVQIEDAEGNVTAEVIDLVLPDPIKAFRNSSTLNKEEVEVEEDLLLESRLWDQVAANLTTLGEMRGIKYKVSPLEEVVAAIGAVKAAGAVAKGVGAVAKGLGKAALSTVKKPAPTTAHEEVDIEAASEQQSPFNVKSPVIFGKKIVEEETREDLVSKYAPNIVKADASMKEGAGEITGSIAGGVAGGAIGGPVGSVVGSIAGGALGSKLDKKKPARKTVPSNNV